jgi:uncharacterized protein YjbI with pentapeptide repeats
LEGASISSTTDFGKSSFRGANIRGIVTNTPLGSSNVGNENLLFDADISGSSLIINSATLQSTRNYLRKNLSNTILNQCCNDCNFSKFNLQRTYFNGSVDRSIFKDADITGAIFKSALISEIPYGMSVPDNVSPITEIYSLKPSQLYTTRNYKEKNLGSVIFIFADFHNAYFRGQT